MGHDVACAGRHLQGEGLTVSIMRCRHLTNSADAIVVMQATACMSWTTRVSTNEGASGCPHGSQIERLEAPFHHDYMHGGYA
eukprot:55413-Eustigmatos_ZCMA.PRE.1